MTPEYLKLRRQIKKTREQIESLQARLREMETQAHQLRLQNQTPPPYYSAYERLPQYLRDEIDAYVRGDRKHIHALRKKLAGYNINHIELTKLTAYLRIRPLIARVESAYFEEEILHDRRVRTQTRTVASDRLQAQNSLSAEGGTDAGDILVFEETA